MTHQRLYFKFIISVILVFIIWVFFNLNLGDKGVLAFFLFINFSIGINNLTYYIKNVLKNSADFSDPAIIIGVTSCQACVFILTLKSFIVLPFLVFCIGCCLCLGRCCKNTPTSPPASPPRFRSNPRIVLSNLPLNPPFRDRV